MREGGGLLVLDDVRVDNGRFHLDANLGIALESRVAVVGPSGAGKSTLVTAIAGFLPVSRGRVLWDGRDISGEAPGERPVAMLFQDGNLFPHLTVLENVGLGIRPSLRLDPGETERVIAALGRVGLGGFEARMPAELSGGQQSRVALARVLVQGRPVLLLDEPFAALGPAMKADMLDLVADLVRDTGATLLMVSHDLAGARRISDQIVLVAEGRVSAPRETEALLADPSPALRAYMGAP